MIVAANIQGIADACYLLDQKQVVGMPTETVYGLAADACRDEAVAQIFAVKKRPALNPLIIHVASPEGVGQYAKISALASNLMNTFWPGPLTLVLPRSVNCPVSLLASAGLDTVALRCPAHPVARKLINAFGKPLAAPSANLSMGISPTCAQDVVDSLGNEVPLVLEGGQCEFGLESTIVDLSREKPVMLRPGSILPETLEEIVGQVSILTKNSSIKAPGMMTRHYAPYRPLRLNALDCQPQEALLGFGPSGDLPVTLNLSATQNLKEAAANLFCMMRQLDRDPYTGMAVMPVPEEGLGIAINDRLRRAATP